MENLTADPAALIREAKAIIERASSQGRDLSDFEAGRCDALLDIAQREQKPQQRAQAQL